MAMPTLSAPLSFISLKSFGFSIVGLARTDTGRLVSFLSRSAILTVSLRHLPLVIIEMQALCTYAGAPLMASISVRLAGELDAGGAYDQFVATTEFGDFSFDPNDGCYLLHVDVPPLGIAVPHL